MLKVFSDGGARGNPGPAGAGIVIFQEDDTVLAKLSKPLGQMTNNQAEYWAVIIALEKLTELLSVRSDITNVRYSLDSQLIEQQLAGNYKVKNEGLKPLYDRVNELLEALPVPVIFGHVPRRKNKHADELANQAMDTLMKESERE